MSNYNVPKGWKLVPVEPTQEWVANLEKVRIGRMESVIEDVLDAAPAAPAVQAEPVATVVERKEGSRTWFDGVIHATAIVMEQIKDGDLLYAAPPAQPDASVLVEALENARRAMHAVLAQEPRLKAVAKRVLTTEIARIDAALSGKGATK